MKFTFCLIVLFTCTALFSQSPAKIKFQKEPGLIYFFPKAAITSSVITTSTDLFYLMVPDSIKKDIIIYVENGRFIKTANDSLVKLCYMRGLKYESQFVISETAAAGSKDLKKEFTFVSLINGPAAAQNNEIRIKIFQKKEEKVLIENLFFYKE